MTRCGDEIIVSAMAVKTEKELSESLRALWLKAVSAIELRNFGYAISLLQEILKQEPEFLTGRRLLRRKRKSHHGRYNREHPECIEIRRIHDAERAYGRYYKIPDRQQRQNK